jgi:transcriptional regulator with XRE-family HTH domain
LAEYAKDYWQARWHVPKVVDDPLLRALGDVIRERRRELRLPQGDVGGVSRVWLQRIEVGTANPSVQSLALIASALETTGSALLAEAERRAQSRCP